MNRILLLSTFAATGLALAVAGCDQQQASDSTSEPLQQQGAVPADGAGSAAPAAGNTSLPFGSVPATGEPQATEPMAPASEMPPSDSPQ